MVKLLIRLWSSQLNIIASHNVQKTLLLYNMEWGYVSILQYWFCFKILHSYVQRIERNICTLLLLYLGRGILDNFLFYFFHSISWRIDAFELWCWRRLLRVPWTARRSNQSILKEISPGCSLEGLMLKLKLQYFGHLIWRANSLEKTLMLGKTEGRRRSGWRRMR